MIKKRLPTIEEMSGSIDFGGRVIFEGDDQIVISETEARVRDVVQLERAVVHAARKLDREFTWTGDFTSVESARAYDDFKRTIRRLNEFELNL